MTKIAFLIIIVVSSTILSLISSPRLRRDIHTFYENRVTGKSVLKDLDEEQKEIDKLTR